MRGIIESLSEFYIIVLGIVVIGILFTTLFNYYGIFENPENVVFTSNVAENLADKAVKCWEEHRSGLDRESDICYQITIRSDHLITEQEFTGFLNCDKLPNNICDGHECDCSSPFFEDNDKVDWFVFHENTTVIMTYDGNNQKIRIAEAE